MQTIAPVMGAMPKRAGAPSGVVEIDTDWQLISTPVSGQKIKSIIDYLEATYAPGCVEVANTYFGGEGAFKTYIPGVTPPASPNNFELIYTDGIYYEYTAYWIKNIYGSVMILPWG